MSIGINRFRVKHGMTSKFMFAKQTKTGLPSCLPVIRKCAAFTLAEILITLGIIGVVAALTMPSMIQNHRKQVVETRLKKFYSTVNQAINMSETKYGDKRFWFENDAYEARREHMNNNMEDSMMKQARKINRADDDMGGGLGDRPTIQRDLTNQKWIDKYLAPYMNIVKREEIIPREMILLYFKDGSGLSYDGRMPDGLLWVFYPSNPKKCIDKYGDHAGGMGICKFSFLFDPEHSSEFRLYHYNKGMEPYKLSWNGDIKTLYDDERFGCNENSQYKLYCTALIQANGWKIPENYPFKF